jgi:hypothetical protein
MLKFLRTIYYKITERNKRFGWFQEVDELNFAGKSIAGDIQRSDLVGTPFHNFIPTDLIDQKNTDFCVAAGKAYAKEATEGMPMSWVGMFALYCKSIGYISSYGASVLGMQKAAVSQGIPERSLWDYHEDRSRDWNANWNNLSSVAIANASIHKDGSFFEASRPLGWDRFDTFRAFLHKFHNKKTIIQTGIDSHNVSLEGQDFHPITKELCLTAIDSYGTQSIDYRIGKSINGIRYFNRKEANQLPTGYFAFDLSRTLAELLNTYNGKAVKTTDSPDCFLVKDGKRRSLVNEYIAFANNTLMFDPNNVYVITQDEMELIPMGSPMTFKEGQFWPVVQRMLEMFNKTDIINSLK